MEGAWESGRQNHPVDSASLATSGPAPEPLLHLSLLFQFKRLQGKRNRGREEINFVEIKGDDQLSGAQQWMTKSLTEEKTMKSFSRKKGEQPTGQQRRKHQITYLIHQVRAWRPGLRAGSLRTRNPKAEVWAGSPG